MTKRSIYLKMIPLESARQTVLETFAQDRLKPQTESVEHCVGRILAEPVFARFSSPGFHASAMDGIAVKAPDTYGANEAQPVKLTIGQNAFYVNTGHILPPHTDSVIMIENVNEISASCIEIIAPAFPWQHVRKMGEDIVATELLFPQNHKVTPYCLGALIAGGNFHVKVRAKPKVVIIPTGSEVIDWQAEPPETMSPGQVLESNGWVLANLVARDGGIPQKKAVVPDNADQIQAAIESAIAQGADMVLTVGGSSAGSEDFTKPVVERLGRILLHGVTMMPGKPVLVGNVNNIPVMGMPGYPVSTIVAYEQLVSPLIHQMLHQPLEKPASAEVQPTRKIPSKLGMEEFLRVKLGQVGNRIMATPLGRGAGVITTLTKADGLIRIPANSEGINADDRIAAQLLRPLSQIQATIVVVGSHDNTLDILADQLRAEHGSVTLSSSHVGSLAGLMALKKGACHLAGAHLLDPQSGTYNLTDIDRYLADIPVRVVHLVRRDQGLMVARNNPLKITGVQDLTRSDLRFINRQKGSGTRILLDYQLEKLGLQPQTIVGYNDEEFTHMSVAAAIISDRADVGMGIFAASKALDLTFIPIITEAYELVIRAEYFETPHLQQLLATIRGPEFQQRVTALGGYHTEQTGKVVR